LMGATRASAISLLEEEEGQEVSAPMGRRRFEPRAFVEGCTSHSGTAAGRAVGMGIHGAVDSGSGSGDRGVQKPAASGRPETSCLKSDSSSSTDVTEEWVRCRHCEEHVRRELYRRRRCEYCTHEHRHVQVSYLYCICSVLAQLLHSLFLCAH
jgi:hypothetical protein